MGRKIEQIPGLPKRVDAPPAYDRFCDEYPHLGATTAPCRPKINLMVVQDIAALVHRIRWRRELKDDWSPAWGWGDCDSKVTRAILELMCRGCRRGSLRIIIGQVVDRTGKPVFHAILSVWTPTTIWIIDPMHQTPMPWAEVADKRVFMHYIEVPGCIDSDGVQKAKSFRIIDPTVPRPQWAKYMQHPGDPPLTLADLYAKALKEKAHVKAVENE